MDAIRTQLRASLVALLCVSAAVLLPALVFAEQGEVRAGENAARDEAAGQAAPAGMELLGSWHLTVHYRDEASANPDAKRWDDKVWRFDKRGSRTQWTEFPIVVFESRGGRFESLASDRAVRTLEYWEPNKEQLAQMQKGLVVNARGAKSKGLRGSPRTGYQSAGGLRSESVSVIGYSESWTVKGLPSMPVFTHDVVMGSGRTEDMQGRTRYAAERMSADGREVHGEFARDGTRHGTFTLRRIADVVVMGGESGSR
jgi:hypothetical protein